MVELRTHAQRKLFTDVSSSPSFSTWSATKFVLLLVPLRLSTSSILHVMLKLMQFEVRALETEGVTMSTKTEMTRLAGVATHLLLFLSPLPLIILLLLTSLHLCLRLFVHDSLGDAFRTNLKMQFKGCFCIARTDCMNKNWYIRPIAHSAKINTCF